jgi:predicted 2-oxoglutarate/Fe(II)-dependent dioxygenase YbiX
MKNIEYDCLAPGIFLYKNVFSEYEKLLSQIDQEGTPWTPGYGSPSRSKKIGFKNVRIVDSATVDVESPNNPEIIEKFDLSLKNCEEHYVSTFGIDILEGKTTISTFLKYSKGHKFEDHTDQVPELKRIISCVYYFNEEYSGGELSFSYFDLQIKPIKNSYIIFPSIWAYSHSAKEVTEGTKYAYVRFLY